MTTETPIPADFPVVWPADANQELTWELDDMHMPFAFSPLALDYVAVIASGFNPSYVEWGLPARIHFAEHNGYCYFAYDPGVPEDRAAAIEARRVEVYREFARVSEAYWRDEALPGIRAIARGIREIDVDGLASGELAAAWEGAWREAMRAWAIHFKVVRGAYQPTDDLADLYETALPGPSAGRDALALIAGGNTTLQRVEEEIERLADIAAGLPEVRARLLTSPPPEVEELPTIEGGPAFVAALGPFLEEHGHLGQAFDDLALPSWSEAPAFFLGELGQRLRHPPERAAARAARLRAKADALAEQVRAKLAGEPDTLAQFEEALDLARTVGPLTEVHNYWIDRMIQARLRALAFRVARRLVRDGSIDVEDDVLYLRRDEVAETLRRGLDRRALVAARRAEHARQRELKAPRWLGTPPRESQEVDRFDARPREQSGTVLTGVGASAGVVRGPARVALGPEDFPRIQAGDVIVCPSSNPSWVPVFTIAAGLVTNTGGILAHAAVVAREFGLPAVVGVTGATTLIRDGQTVEIDGTEGTVRIL